MHPRGDTRPLPSTDAAISTPPIHSAPLHLVDSAARAGAAAESTTSVMKIPAATSTFLARFPGHFVEFAQACDPRGMRFTTTDQLRTAVTMVEQHTRSANSSILRSEAVHAAQRTISTMINVALYRARLAELKNPSIEDCIEVATACRVTPGFRYCDFTLTNMPIIHSLFTLPKLPAEHSLVSLLNRFGYSSTLIGNGGRLAVYMTINRGFNFVFDYQNRSGNYAPLSPWQMIASISASAGVGVLLERRFAHYKVNVIPLDFRVSPVRGIFGSLALGLRRTCIPLLSTAIGHTLDVNFSRSQEYTTQEGAPLLYERHMMELGQPEYIPARDLETGQLIQSREAGARSVALIVAQRVCTAASMVGVYTLCTPMVEAIPARFRPVRLAGGLVRLAAACFLGIPLGASVIDGHWRQISWQGRNLWFNIGQ